MALRSAPAQNAIPPAPVRTITRASSSASKRSSAASSASAVGPSTALRRSGRSIVTTAAAPRRSYRTGSGMRRAYGPANGENRPLGGSSRVNRSPPGRSDSPASGPALLAAGRLDGGLLGVLALLEPPLQQRDEQDEERERGDQEEARVRDVLVVDRAQGAFAGVLGQGGRREEGQQRE